MVETKYHNYFENTVKVHLIADLTISLCKLKQIKFQT